MPTTLVIEVFTAADPPVRVDLAQLNGEQRNALKADIKEQLAQQVLPSGVKYAENAATFTIEVEDGEVDGLLNAEAGPLVDFAGLFDGVKHAFTIKRGNNGGRRRGKKTRKPKRKSRLTRRR